MNNSNPYKETVEPRLLTFLNWLNDRLIALHERIIRYKQRRGL